MPAKHQPDLIYLRYVPLWKVHIFTVVQLTCLILLWVIKASAAAVVFPMMVSLFFPPPIWFSLIHYMFVVMILLFEKMLMRIHCVPSSEIRQEIPHLQ